ncbi:hypothetical protein [Streptomyces sp. NPDC088775]|uniref:hypothetical protein n=1 Tax=Streptomyces sp. NPDC088775 TaxID=3365896 RepID=UPI0038092AD8
MTSNPPKAISVEQLGVALDALGWHPSVANERAATRTEMLGLLRFIVDAELLQVDEPGGEEEVSIGLMLGLETRARSSVSTEGEYAMAYLKLWLQLVAHQTLRVGADVATVVEAVDPTFGTGDIARALANALMQLLRVPAATGSEAFQAGSPLAVKNALGAARPFIQEARQHLEDGRRKLKKGGF